MVITFREIECEHIAFQFILTGHCYFFIVDVLVHIWPHLSNLAYRCAQLQFVIPDGDIILAIKFQFHLRCIGSRINYEFIFQVFFFREYVHAYALVQIVVVHSAAGVYLRLPPARVIAQEVVVIDLLRIFTFYLRCISAYKSYPVSMEFQYWFYLCLAVVVVVCFVIIVRI